MAETNRDSLEQQPSYFPLDAGLNAIYIYHCGAGDDTGLFALFLRPLAKILVTIVTASQASKQDIPVNYLLRAFKEMVADDKIQQYIPGGADPKDISVEIEFTRSSKSAGKKINK